MATIPHRNALLQSNPRWCHEVRHQGQTTSRHSVLKAAKVKKEQCDLPPQPIGPHFIDIGVKVVVPNTPVVIAEGAAASGAAAASCATTRIVVEPRQLFPSVTASSDSSASHFLVPAPYSTLSMARSGAPSMLSRH